MKTIETIALRKSRGTLLAIGALFSVMLLGGATQASARDYHHDDRRGYDRHDYHYHHHGYWHEHNGSRVWIDLGG